MSTSTNFPSSPKEETKQEAPRVRALSIDDLGPGITESSYLIRGSVLHRANELRALQEKGVALPFERFYPLHYGNPQLLGQPPITFLRQVIAATFCPSLLDTGVFPEDVKERVKYYLANIPNGAIGAYSDAPGFPVFRKAVADYITKRDGFPSYVDNIYLTDGTLDGMNFVLRLLFSRPGIGVMLPSPEYPGYSFSVTQMEGTAIKYSLNEEDDWSVKVFFNFFGPIFRKDG